MYITNKGFAVNENITPQAEMPAAINRTSDINFFNAQVSQTEHSGKGIVPAMASPSFSWGSTESATLSRRVSKAFRDASQNKKTTEANEFPQLLAEAHIELTSRVKVISALAKGIDKISSMG
ncbi:hypothetical protein ACI77J_08975 [Pseudomonas sp. O64]|uniref:hypothetical protein n=1 Tax=Pseudomonas TaxID=286 RepID=UPI000BA02ACE|nr:MULTISPECIES: hypothetical protein [unclassified Pseudomonas]MCV2230156.1 hypothetical protein [Pseudomonas sp. AU10]OZO06313.1 hypothetical protein B7453_01215 [Pseudomonas sp. IB20]UNM20808.1 hypothetical protein K0P33_04880 [Pseudomonas sp. ArH3a]UXZ23597.1 hypothetical protein KZH41_05055 [Pseudomonas sp. YeP6b]